MFSKCPWTCPQCLTCLYFTARNFNQRTNAELLVPFFIFSNLRWMTLVAKQILRWDLFVRNWLIRLAKYFSDFSWNQRQRFIALRIVRWQGLVFKKGQIKPRTKYLPLFTELGPTDRPTELCPHPELDPVGGRYILLNVGNPNTVVLLTIPISGVPRGGLGCSTPPPKIPKTLQNCAKLNPICENC